MLPRQNIVGAPSGKELEKWEHIRNTTINQSLINQSLVQLVDDKLVNCLHVLTCRSLDEWFRSVMGLALPVPGQPTPAAPNPFLGACSIDGNDNFFSSLLLYRESRSRPHLDALLRCLPDDSARALYYVLTTLDSAQTRASRQLFISALEGGDATTFQLWKSYFNQPLSEVSDPEEARAACLSWWSLVDRLYAQHVALLLASLPNGAAATEFEGVLESWRCPQGYFEMGFTHRDEVMTRERLLFKELVFHVPITWERRRTLLGLLLKHGSMNLLPFMDLRLYEFESAASYKEWMSAFDYCCKTADCKGFALRPLAATPAPRITFADTPRLPPPAVVKAEHPSPRDPPNGATAHCRYCKEAGHDVDNCAKLRAKNNREAGMPSIDSPAGTLRPPIHGVPSVPLVTTRAGPPLPPTQASAAPYTTRSGRTSRPPPSSNPVLVTSVSSDHAPESAQEDNPLPYTGFDEVVTLRTDVAQDDLSSMPGVPVRVQGVLLRGLIDSASTVNFMTQSAFEQLSVSADLLRPAHLSVSTMTGSTPYTSSIATLDIAICDDDGYWSQSFETDVILCPSIPGGFEILLNVAWLSQCEISLVGASSVRRPRVIRSNPSISMVTSGCQTPDTTDGSPLISLATIPSDDCAPGSVEGFDRDPVEIHGRLDQLRLEAVQIGILSATELEAIWDCIRVPQVELSFKQGQESPPIRRRGFPQSGVKTAAARSILTKLVDMGVLEQVPRGSGRFTSPGFVVPKPHSTSFRFVVDYGPVNDRLLRPSAMHHHSSKEWSQSIPSTAHYYAVLDMKDAFFNVPLSPRSQEFLHVDVFDCGQYRFKYMPQGLMLASAIFTELIENITFALREFLSAHPQHASLLVNCHIILYVDDILICGDNLEDVGVLMKIVIQVLSYGGLCISKEKIQLPSDTVKVMGVMLSRGHIFADPEKISQILNLQRPTTRLQLQSCLGLLNYCRSTIRPPGLLQPLHRGMSSKRGFEWTSEMESAWILVVEHVRNFPLSQFCLFPGVEDLTRWTLLLQSDASDHSIGYSVWLIPVDTSLLNLDVTKLISADPDPTTPDAYPRLISIGFRSLTPAESRYAAHDREALGIYTNLMRHKALVHLFPRTVYQSDNVISVSRFGKRALPDEDFFPNVTRGRRWIRWFHDLSDILYLSSDDSTPRVTFLHVPGPDNGLCDYLSRYIKLDSCLIDVGTQMDDPNAPISLVTDVHPVIASLPVLSPSRSDQLVLSDALRNGWKLSLDPVSAYMGVLLVDIYSYLSLGNVSHPKTRKVADKRFSVSADGLLRIQLGLSNTICVPHVLITLGDGRVVQLRSYLIWYFHEGSVLHLAHRGYHSVLSKVRSLFHWNRMDLSILNWIGSCLGCVASKGLQFNGDYTPRLLSHVNQLVALDFAVGITIADERFFVLVLVDAFSGYCMLLKSKDKSSLTVAKGVIEWCALFGVPSGLCHDNEPSFRGEVLNYLKQAAQLPDLVSPTFSPMTQGSAERTVRIIKEGIFAINSSLALHPPTFAYDCVLSAISFANNSTPRADNISPFQLMLGREPQDFMSLRFSPPSLTAHSRNDYVVKLQSALETVRGIWESKAHELKTIRHDRLAASTPDLLPGDQCVRVAYMNGQRLVFDKVISVQAKTGSNTYLVRPTDDSSAPAGLVHGYQLHKLEPTTLRDGWTLPPVPPSPTSLNPELAIRSALFSSPVGTLVGTMYRNRIYIGETTQQYVEGDQIPILFYLPSSGGRFTRPTSHRRIVQSTFDTQLSEIIKVGVRLSPTGICDVSQFD